MNLCRNQSLEHTAQQQKLTVQLGFKKRYFNCSSRETKIALFFEHVFLLSGEAGKPGKNKPLPGPRGPKGDQGPQGAKGERGQGNGVTYVRWGRKSCPSGTQIVYQGKKNRWTTH